MPLPPHFQFSQGSLQDYLDCPRRFELRYMLRLAWPAVEAEPALEYERHQKMGASFHRLIQQHLIGVPARQLTQMVQSTTREGDALRQWWQNYMEYLAAPAGLRLPASMADLVGLPLPRLAEVGLSAPLCGYRLVAKYDAIAVLPDKGENGSRLIIFDWKTSLHRPRRESLASRLQTRVYQFLLVQAGAHLAGGQPPAPEQVEMLYWFASFPDQPERFSYSAEQYHQDSDLLASLVSEIAAAPEGGFTSGPEGQGCRFCTYRSLCGRGVEAGDMSEPPEYGGDEPEDGERRPDAPFDFEQIAEIEF